jgi:ABC-2 type transport system ATP-binding protein
MVSSIEVRDLRRTYGDVIAVDGISFEVKEGEIFGLVGPNGAGKTTTVECMEGLRRPTSGQVRLLGLDPSRERLKVAERIGVQLQESALPPRLHVAMTSWTCLGSTRNGRRPLPICRVDKSSVCS